MNLIYDLRGLFSTSVQPLQPGWASPWLNSRWYRAAHHWCGLCLCNTGAMGGTGTWPWVSRCEKCGVLLKSIQLRVKVEKIADAPLYMHLLILLEAPKKDEE